MKELVKLDLGSLGQLGDNMVQEQFDVALSNMLLRFNDDNVKRDKESMVTGSITITVQFSQFHKNQELSTTVDVSSKEPGLRQSRTNLQILDGSVCLDVTPNPQQAIPGLRRVN